MMNHAIKLAAFCSIFLTIGVSGQEEYQQVARDIHNEFRSRHQVGPLSLSDDLNFRAKQCAQYYADKGTIDHSCSDKNGAGENLYAMWGGSPSDTDAARDATNSWYSEEPQHDYNGDWQPSSGHFSQLVWKGSNEIGFGTARNGDMIVGVALYNPAGNMMGDFQNNVFPPQ